MKKILFLILFLFAFLERVIFDLGPNIELLTMVMLLANAYLGRRCALWLVFLVLVLSDTVLGNTSIFIFTWTGFLLPAIYTSRFFSKHKNEEGLKRVVTGISLGLGSNLFFYLWTNFGVWLLDVWGMYPKTITGLIMSYINGLPFLRLHFLSTLIFVPLGFSLIELVVIITKRIVDKWSLQIGYLQSFK